ncbi:centrosome-associated protein 350 isoform X2 [Zootoca vivipara]|uniref:centrosome-associated protein 350 isoform X2 n=1 Tax=Zootoca vivipara TaxID=8524 RepID=UPI00293BC590|nr:centrosome-associated protein 350 isoform X2 [Zootoca vivipara]
MWRNELNDVPLQKPRSFKSRIPVRVLTSARDAFSQTNATLQHIENKLEVAPNSTAVLESVMDSKKPSASTTRKISRKASRSSSQKERSLRCPLRVTTLDSNVGKSGHVEFHEPLVASFRGTPWSPSYKTSCQPEARCLKLKEVGNKTERMKHFTYEKSESNLNIRDFQSPSFADETVVRYLNDRPAIDALQNSEVFFKSVSEEEKAEKSRDEYSKTSQSTTTLNVDLKELQLAESSASSTSTSSAHRLDILKQHQHEAKLEKLKERIRKQLERPEELSSRGNHLGYDDHPIPAAAVTPKVRKIAAAHPAPSYKGFNPSEAKIRTPDGKVWREEEFINRSRELCPDLELQLAEDNLAVKLTTAEKNKEKKATRPVRKIQKVTQFPSPDSKPGSTSVISTSSWREGLRLAKKLLGPAPKVGQQDQEPLSIDRAGKDKPTKSAFHSEKTDTNFKLDVTVETRSRNTERSQSKVRVESNTKKKESTLPDSKQREDHVNKDFLPVEIRGMLDDLQLDSVSQGAERMREEERQDQKSPPFSFIRSHSPTKRKPDKLSASEEPQVTSKKRYYDTDEVRQYIVRQKEERKKRQNEEKKAQKVATEQKNKRLQELYKKQKEALANKTKGTLAPELATKQLQETYSKLFLEQTLLEEPLVPGQESKPGYQPSGESDKENKVQERPPSTSSSSDMSLSEAPHPLIRNNFLDPLWIQPDRLTSEAQLSSQQPSFVLTGGFVSQLLALDHIDVLQNDSVLSSRRGHNTAVGSIPLASQPVMASAVQPTINQYKNKLNRIEALKATAASLSSRIESEAKKLAGASINYGEVWNTERDLLQGDQGDGSWTMASSPPVDEEDVFSARLQKMLGTCTPHTSFDDNLPGVGNLGEFKRLPETLSPRAATISLPGNYRTEGMLGNLSKKQACSPGAESKVVAMRDGSIESISEGPLSDGLASEEEGERREHPTLKTLEVLKEKEFCAADIAGCEPIKEVQKEAEKCLLIFRHIRSTWEELIRGSPHSAINIFTKYYQLCGKGFEQWSGQAPPTQEPLLPVMSPPASIDSYEDDFISSQESVTIADKRVPLQPSGSSPSLKEEFATRKSSYEQQAVEFTHHSSGTLSAGSSNSSASSKKRVKKEKSESFSTVPSASLREENKMLPGSEYGSQQVKNVLPNNGIPHREDQSPDSDSTLEELSAHSLMSLPDKIRSPRTPSSPHSPSLQKPLDPAVNTAEKIRPLSNSLGTITSGPKANHAFSDMNLGTNRTGAGNMNGTMRFSPAGLQHRMSAELNYLSAIEESVRQISDVERVRGISLAQQESVSLAQILKAQQQQHERDLALLKLKAEQEALESQRQLDEAMKKAAQGHAESIQQLVQSQQETVGALQETTCKIAAQQMETALLTTDAARQIREMTELARVQISGAIGAPATPMTTLIDQERKQHSAFIKKLKSHNTSRKAESIPSQSKEEIDDSKLLSSSFDSYTESPRSKAHDQSSSSSCQESPFVSSSKGTKKLSRREKSGSSIEEQVPMAVNDSLMNDTIPSIADERDSASVATEYSLKFDESMTEDEIEEKSFRSLLPSESHRRINLKKRVHQDYSDEEAFPGRSTMSPVKELSLPFSRGQDSFSKFTMEMVRQYMKEEEMRSAHQSSLLRLREKALKEKARAELAWLEHQKKRLRDKGEDDKMPPIRKKQRGLLLKLKQEKAEIKRLKEANKAARKERQLILKQQEEIERIRQTTMKLQEKLKSAGENKLEPCSEDDIKQTRSSTPLPSDAETWSLSSVSGSETSSIMQKLKKMRSQMDEKFLTKREQKLMKRRQHAEELLQWKRRLDAEEEEICQIEKQALAAWDMELLKAKVNRKGAGDQKSDAKEIASEDDFSVPPCSHLNNESSVPEELGSVAVENCPSKISEDQEQLESLDQKLTEEIVYEHSPSKSSTSLSKQESGKGTHRIAEQQNLSTKSQDVSYSWSDESFSMTQSETASDQSDIESRIQALQDKLRKRKSVVYQLKKERKKRYKERLKAQEASLIKQLETYDEFIKKTEAELSWDLEATSTAKPQIKTPSSATEKPKIKSSPLNRSESTKSWKSITDSERPRVSLESIAEHVDAASHEKSVSAYTKKFIEAEIQTEEHSRTISSSVHSTRKSRAEPGGSLESLASSSLFKDLGDLNKASHVSQDRFEDAESYDSTVSTNRSVIQEEIESLKSEESEAEVSQKVSERCDAYKLDKELKSSPPASLKADVCPEAELLGKNQIELAFVERKTEMRKETNKGDKSALTIESSPTLSKELLKGDALVSEKISICKEPTYSNDFEVSSSGTEMSKDETPLTEYYKDDFDTFSLSLEKDSMSQGEKSCYTKTPRSSIGSDDEVSECLSDKSSSVAGSVHSERLLELKSPTEFMKSRERSDVEEESAYVDSSLWVSISKAEEENILKGFNIGDRVLVSNVQPGTLRFKGLTEFAKGFWAGVELDKPEGNNNGTYNGIHYFNCKEKHGIFAPPQKISRILESSNSFMDTAENSFCKQELNHHKVDQNEKENLEEESEGRNISKECPQNSSPRDASAVEDSPAAEDCITFASPLLDLLTKERSQLEAQLRVPSQEEEELIEQKEKVGLLADSLLQAFVKDTVDELQQIGKVKNEKIQCSNQDLCSVQEKRLQSILISELDDGEEVYSPDMYPRPESPVCCASGQEELAKRLAELELSREFLDLSEDEQDWFEEDFGLSSHKLIQKEAGDVAETEPPKVPSKPCEELLAVPHTAEEVEELVHAAAEELWKCKKLGHEIQAFRLPRDITDSSRDDDVEAVSEQIYKQAVFDLTREIFEEIFAEDPNLNQPMWMKSCRIITGYYHRVKDPNDLEEIKCFIATEVLRLLNLKKEPNHKMEWQKTMKFGRKKRDRVDHILTQELHEEEAQWVNYDEDELQVKMQLADGIFDALIKDTVDVLHQINEKHEKLLPV